MREFYRARQMIGHHAGAGGIAAKYHSGPVPIGTAELCDHRREQKPTGRSISAPFAFLQA